MNKTLSITGSLAVMLSVGFGSPLLAQSSEANSESTAIALSASISSASASVVVNVDTACQETQAGLDAFNNAGIGVSQGDTADALFAECDWLKGWGKATLSDGSIIVIGKEDMATYWAGGEIILANGTPASLPAPAPVPPTPPTWREYVATLPVFEGPWDSLNPSDQQLIVDCSGSWKKPGMWNARPAPGCRAKYGDFFAGS